MDALNIGPSLYDVLLDTIRFDTDEEIQSTLTALLHGPPKEAIEARGVLSYLLSEFIHLRKLDLLGLLLGQEGIVVESRAVKAAAALPFALATIYLEILFAHGWDINRALSNTQPPVLSVALHDEALISWLLERGADPNSGCDTDITPLSIAVRESAFSTVQLLLRHAQHQHNGHLVFFAMGRADVDETIKVIQLLHLHHKPVDEVIWQDVKSFILRGFFLLGTPLYYAIVEDRVQVALTLLDLGADPDKQCLKWGQSVGPSPREVAIRKGGPIAARLTPNAKERIPSSL